MLNLKEKNLFYCPLEELKDIVNRPDFPKAKNYMIIVGFPKFSDKSKGGILLDINTFERLKLGVNCGRILSIGSTVGAGKGGALEEAKSLQIGDWVHFRPHTGYPIYHFDQMFYVLKDEDITVGLSNPFTVTDELFTNHVEKENNS